MVPEINSINPEISYLGNHKLKSDSDNSFGEQKLYRLNYEYLNKKCPLTLKWLIVKWQGPLFVRLNYRFNYEY